METTLIAGAIILVSLIAGYGYYLIFSRDLEEFESKKEMKTRYRTNEEFIKS
jgi:Tfp pilus assembly protein PilO